VTNGSMTIGNARGERNPLVGGTNPTKESSLLEKHYGGGEKTPDKEGTISDFRKVLDYWVEALECVSTGDAKKEKRPVDTHKKMWGGGKVAGFESKEPPDANSQGKSDT